MIDEADYRAVVAAALHQKTAARLVSEGACEREQVYSAGNALRLLDVRMQERIESYGENPLQALTAITITMLSLLAHMDERCCTLAEQALSHALDDD